MIALLGESQRYEAMAAAAQARYHDTFAPLPARWVEMLTASAVRQAA